MLNMRMWGAVALALASLAPAVHAQYGGGGQRMTCESQDGRTRQCALPRGARVQIAHQLSNTRCVQGRNWGVRGGSLWVSNGCRAEFVVTHGRGSPGPVTPFNQGNGQITCESQDRRDHSCNWNPRWGRPYLLKQLSDDTCREGYSWGYDYRGGRIWVTRGCRGRFGSR